MTRAQGGGTSNALHHTRKTKAYLCKQTGCTHCVHVHGNQCMQRHALENPRALCARMGELVNEYDDTRAR
ncbi:hypothetical protein PanWU01x14_338870 [Parasponia andersonii]|uniref:Uncharacterized protein n=1 Tax=Parasponia andersonii TaxID=3476 RepID=A0A2P5AEZ5_PARAD|nr:hypothetical protein PanWU01x14_338870 [Parasponia andersonii]